MAGEDLPPPLEDCSHLFSHRKNAQNVCTAEKKIKKKYNGFASGFLNKPLKQKKRNKVVKRKPLEFNEKTDLEIDEAKKQTRNTAEGKVDEFVEKLSKDKDTFKKMMTPEFGKAMDEMSKNPKEALMKYKDDPNILPTLKNIIETMTSQSLSSFNNQVESQIREKSHDDQFLRQMLSSSK